MEVRTFAKSRDAAEAARAEFLAIARAAIRSKGSFTIALAGGHSFEDFYRGLEPGDLDWSRVHVFFGDERCVPQDHQDSNFRMAYETLFSRVPIPPENVKRIPVELEPRLCAQTYEGLIRAHFDAMEGTNRGFDLCLLGLGADGHCASLFPGSDALTERDRLCVAAWVEGLSAWRITLTFPAFEQASKILFLILGNEKAAALERCMSRSSAMDLPPAGKVGQCARSAIWFADESAAALI